MGAGKCPKIAIKALRILLEPVETGTAARSLPLFEPHGA